MDAVNPKDFQFEKINHQGLTFVPFYSRKYIDEQVQETADQISQAYKDKHPVFIGILNGAFMFLSDLIQRLTIQNFQIEFVKVATYSGTESTEIVKELISLKTDIQDRDILIVDDIIDTGITMHHLINWFEKKNPRSISVCSAVWKQPQLIKEFKIDYPAIILKHDLFVLGYGMDFDQFGRNLRDIYILQKDLQKLVKIEREFQFEKLIFKGLEFLPLFPRKVIDAAVDKVAVEISNDYREKKPIFIGILNSAFVFLSDLVQQLSIFNFEIQFVKLESFQEEIGGEVKNIFVGLKGSIQDRDVIIVDDIIDTGVTMEKILNSVEQHTPSSISVCSFLWKQRKLMADIKVDYHCLTLEEDQYVIGFGMDFDEQGRNLKDIYALKAQE